MAPLEEEEAATVGGGRRPSREAELGPEAIMVGERVTIPWNLYHNTSDKSGHLRQARTPFTIPNTVFV